MADDLKRVGIVFTADGQTDFKNSLKNVSAELKANQTEFQKTKAAYDEHTTAVKKLTDQYDFFTKQSESYRKKADLLRDSLDELKKKEAENYKVMQEKRAEAERLQKELDALKNSENADADAVAKKAAEYSKAQGELKKLVSTENDYNAKIAASQANLDAATTSMGKFSKAAEDAEKDIKNGSAALDDMQKKLDGFSQKSGSVGSALTKGVTAPIAAVATASVAAYKTIDDAEDSITKMVGTAASSDAIEQFHRLYTNADGFTSGDIADAVGEISTRFGVQGTALYNLSEQWLKFARATDADIIPSVDSAQKVIESFNLSVSDAPALLDAVTAAAQNSGLSTQTITDDMVKYGSALKSMGMDAGGAIEFLTRLEKSGADMDQVMTGLSKVLVDATAKGQTASEALSEAFKNFASDDTGADHLQDAMMLIQNGLSRTVAASEDTSKGFKAVAKSMKAYTGDARSQLAALGLSFSEADSVMADFEASGADIDDGMKKLVSSISSAGSSGNDLSLGLQNIAGSFDDVATTATGATAITQLFGTKGGAAIAQMLQDGTLTADMFSGMESGLQDTVGTVNDVDDALHGADEDMQAVMNNITDAGAQIGSTLMPILADLLNQLLPFIHEFADWWAGLDDQQKKTVIKIAAIAAGLGPVITGISKITSGLSGLIGEDGIIRKLISLTGTGGLFAQIAAFLAGPGGIIMLIAAVVAGVVLLYQHCEPFRDFVNGLGKDVAAFFSALGEFLAIFGSEFWSGVTDGARTIWEWLQTVSQAIGDFIEAVVRGYVSIVIAEIKAAVAVFSAIGNAIKSVVEAIVGWIVGAITGAVDTVEKIFTAAFNFYKNIFETIWGWIKAIADGIGSVFGWIGNSVSGVGSWIGNLFNGSGKKTRRFADGGILTRPTVFARSGDTNYLGGEAGAEAVLPIDSLVGYMQQVNDQQTQQLVSALADAVTSGVYSALKRYAPTVELDGAAVGSVVDGRVRKLMK